VTGNLHEERRSPDRRDERNPGDGEGARLGEYEGGRRERFHGHQRSDQPRRPTPVLALVRREHVFGDAGEERVVHDLDEPDEPGQRERRSGMTEEESRHARSSSTAAAARRPDAIAPFSDGCARWSPHA
jgi:hypothetical protein